MSSTNFNDSILNSIDIIKKNVALTIVYQFETLMIKSSCYAFLNGTGCEHYDCDLMKDFQKLIKQIKVDRQLEDGFASLTVSDEANNWADKAQRKVKDDEQSKKH